MRIYKIGFAPSKKSPKTNLQDRQLSHPAIKIVDLAALKLFQIYLNVY